MGVRTVVHPKESSIDEDFYIRVSGLDPNQQLTIQSHFCDIGHQWKCSAQFEANSEGVVDTRSAAPSNGDYKIERQMGIVEFANPKNELDKEIPNSNTQNKYIIQIEVKICDETVDKKKITRIVRDQVVNTMVVPPHEKIAGKLYWLDKNESKGIIVMIHGSSGIPSTRWSSLLALRGYSVFSIQYFGDKSYLEDNLCKVSLNYFNRSIDYVKSWHDSCPELIALFSWSRGTEAAFLTAAMRDDIDKIVAYSPSAYVWAEDPNTDASRSNDECSAWSRENINVPFLSYRDGPPPRETQQGIRPCYTHKEIIRKSSEKDLSNSLLPISEINSDVLLISGEDDGIWNSNDMAKIIAAELNEVDNKVVYKSYKDAGHKIIAPYHPTTERAVESAGNGPDLVRGGSALGNAIASEDSWASTVEFL